MVNQARYQSHVEELHERHGKEVMSHLERIVSEEHIEHIIFAGDAVILPILRAHLPPALAGKVVDELSLNMHSPAQAVLKATLEAMRQYDSRTDAEEVRALMGAYRAGGLATAGAESVMNALTNGQVETLLISASFDASPEAVEGQKANDLITGAKQTAARIRFIEDNSLLEPLGGVGATLRYRV